MRNWFRDMLGGVYSNEYTTTTSSPDWKEWNEQNQYLNASYQNQLQNQQQQYYQQLQFIQSTAGLDPMLEKRAELQAVHKAARDYTYERVLCA